MDELFDFEINPEEMFQDEVEDNEKKETSSEEKEEEEKELEKSEKSEKSEETEEEDLQEPVKIFYNYVVENGLIDEIENFDGSIETLKQELENLPVKSFKKAVDSLPDIAKQVVTYVFSKDDITLEDFKNFIQNEIEPAYSEIVITDVESARNYLIDKYKKMGIYSDDDDMLEAVDLLEEKGTLIKTAKQLADKENKELKEILENKIQSEVKEREERIRIANEETKRLTEELKKTVESLSWHENRKKAVFENLRPEVLQRKNEAIRKSPKAIVQLADVYSYFNEETGEFDFTKLIDAKVSGKQNADVKERMVKDKFSSAIASLGKQLPERKEKSILEVVDYDESEIF